MSPVFQHRRWSPRSRAAEVVSSLGNACAPALRFALAFALSLAGPALLLGQPVIPLAQVLTEAEGHRTARRPAEAAALLDRVLARTDAGEKLPAGLTPDRVLLAAANAHFQSQGYAAAETLARRLLSSKAVATLAPATSAEARLVLGLALALQEKFAEAVPVFGALADAGAFKSQALLYRALAAQQAGQFTTAIESYNRLLIAGPVDAEWAEAALALIALHLDRENIAEARRGLTRLRTQLELVDNVAGLNALSLRLGDALLEDQDAAGALEAYRTVRPRVEVARQQAARHQRLEAAIARLQALTRGNVAEVDSIRRLRNRSTQARAALAEIEKQPHYDATRLYRLGTAFEQNGEPWEAALVFARLRERHPESPDAERAQFALVRAYAGAGRLDRVGAALDALLQTFPQSDLIAQAFYVAAQAASTRGDAAAQLRFLERGIARVPQSPLREPMLLMQANGLFAAGRHDEARLSADAYLAAYPAGNFVEEAVYLRAMVGLVQGRAGEALMEIKAYLERFPGGRFVADARYRVAAAEFALQRHASASAHLSAWLTDFPEDHPQRGEVLSLEGDVAVATDRPDDAIARYTLALKRPLADEQLGYVLDELTKLYQARRDYDAGARLWEEFAREHPDHPFVLNAAYWIARLRAREGRVEEALLQTATIARRYLADPERDGVERVLLQFAQLLARPAPPDAKGKRPPPPSDVQVETRVAALLLTDDNRASPTAQARVLFATAEIATLRKNTAFRDELHMRLSTSFPPEVLPAGLLARLGDYARETGDRPRAQAFYERLVQRHPRSWFADSGYVGLGELALDDGRAGDALAAFTDAIDRAGARYKLLEATLGRARALLALERFDAAKELFEQVAANRAWRGEATAQSVFSLGDILFRQGGAEKLAQAQAHFQRVYITYRKFTPWVARAYVRSGETFEHLGQPKEALATYRELLRDPRLAALPEAEQARAGVARLAKEEA